MKTQVAATSVGLTGGIALLDLDYDEDSSAEIDFNVVQLGTGQLVEVQGTAERAPFSRKDMDRVMSIAESGIQQLLSIQTKTLTEWRSVQP